VGPAVGEVVRVEVASLDDHGQGVGEFRGRRVAVAGALPGDVVEGRLTWLSAASPWARADLVALLAPSPHRVPNGCAHAPRCVGCGLVSLAAAAQLAEKRARLCRALEEAGITDVAPPAVTPAPSLLGYRSRAKYVVEPRAGEVVLGAYAAGSHRVEPTTSCRVTHPAVGQAARALQEVLSQHPGLVTPPGLRHVVVRANAEGQVLGVLVVRVGGQEATQAMAAAWSRAVPDLAGVVEHVNSRPGDAIFDESRHDDVTLTGAGHLREDVAGVAVDVPHRAFTQLHPGAAALLYARAAHLLAPLEGRVVLDAYCGVGGFALALRGASRVVGVDSAGPSVEAAAAAARRAGLTHVSFEHGDAGAWMARVAAGEGPRPDVVVLDPPRKGLAPEALAALLALHPARLLYVSCEPRALARDLVTLRRSGFLVERLEPLDLFPQTPEVEALVVLRGA
jgi:23S rRNA (uracil1939-C5)-methyltransferase